MKVKYISFCVLLILLTACSSSKRKQSKKKKEQAKKEIVQQKNQKKIADKGKETLVATSSVKVTRALVLEYINNHKDIAMVEMQRYKIPASITLAQAILESGVGQGRLAQQARNHFGIKCHLGWEGDSIIHDDDELDECFRKYTRVEQSFEDHSLFLVNRSRYRFLFSLRPDDYKGWAKGLKKAGYATDPKYADKLISIIERYELHQYDKQVLNAQNKQNNKVNEQDNRSNEQSYKVKEGDTLYSIARKFGVSVKDLVKINQIEGNLIKIGQELKLPKTKK